MIYTIYGKPKVGKTTFALKNAPAKTAVINSDKGLMGIDTTSMTIIDDITGATLNELISDTSFIKKHDRIVIDTATQFYEDILAELSGGKNPSLSVRGSANNIFSQFLRYLRDSNKEVVVLCQERIVAPTEDWVPDDSEEEQVASVTVDLPQGAAKSLTVMSDCIGRLYMTYVNDSLQRKLWLVPTPGIVAGTRSQRYHGRPPALSTPTMERLNKLLGWK